MGATVEHLLRVCCCEPGFILHPEVLDQLLIHKVVWDRWDLHLQLGGAIVCVEQERERCLEDRPLQSANNRHAMLLVHGH